MTLTISDLILQSGINPKFAAIALFILIIAIIWSFIWKGLALWKSARLNQPAWFIILLVVNTFGILEILYIFLFSEIKLEKKSAKVRRKR